MALIAPFVFAIPWPGHNLGDSQIQLGLTELELSLGLIELGLVRAWIDLEEQIPFLDVCPLLKGDHYDIPGHTGNDAHRI